MKRVGLPSGCRAWRSSAGRKRAAQRLRPVVADGRGRARAGDPCRDRAAPRHGARRGMRLTDARALNPGLSPSRPIPPAMRRCSSGLARWAGRWSPLVEVDGDGRPAARRQRGRASVRRRGGLVARYAARFGALGLTARGAIAPTAAAAWALARFGSPVAATRKRRRRWRRSRSRRCASPAGRADARAARPQDHRAAGRDRAAQPRAALPRGRQSARCARPRARAQGRAADRRAARRRRRAPPARLAEPVDRSRGRGPGARLLGPAGGELEARSSARGSCAGRLPGRRQRRRPGVATADPEPRPAHLSAPAHRQGRRSTPASASTPSRSTADWAEPLGAAQDSLVEEPSGEQARWRGWSTG